jgi:hypothetical protein
MIMNVHASSLSFSVLRLLHPAFAVFGRVIRHVLEAIGAVQRTARAEVRP